jgi:hypothetical protein
VQPTPCFSAHHLCIPAPPPSTRRLRSLNLDTLTREDAPEYLWPAVAAAAALTPQQLDAVRLAYECYLQHREPLLCRQHTITAKLGRMLWLSEDSVQRHEADAAKTKAFVAAATGRAGAAGAGAGSPTGRGACSGSGSDSDGSGPCHTSAPVAPCAAATATAAATRSAPQAEAVAAAAAAPPPLTPTTGATEGAAAAAGPVGGLPPSHPDAACLPNTFHHWSVTALAATLEVDAAIEELSRLVHQLSEWRRQLACRYLDILDEAQHAAAILAAYPFMVDVTAREYECAVWWGLRRAWLVVEGS